VVVLEEMVALLILEVEPQEGAVERADIQAQGA
jgi:hypothetical protein